jgi:prephenate dehydratase
VFRIALISTNRNADANKKPGSELMLISLLTGRLILLSNSLLESRNAKSISTSTPPTYITICAIAIKSAEAKMYNPDKLINATKNRKIDRTRFLIVTTSSAEPSTIAASA